MMKLQLAIDLVDTAGAIALVKEIGEENLDIVEMEHRSSSTKGSAPLKK